jgi:hypothetical protein
MPITHFGIRIEAGIQCLSIEWLLSGSQVGKL